MRKLLLLALVGLVVAVGLAVPFSELKNIAEDFVSEDPGSDYMDIEDEESDEDLNDHDPEEHAAADNHEDSDESDDDEDDEADTAVDKISDPQFRLRPSGRWIRNGQFRRRVLRFRRSKKPARRLRRPRPDRRRSRVRRG